MPIFALVDANSFYASCEMAFQPHLAQRPVVVLSNNDGCIVAANARAKSLAKHVAQNFGTGGYSAASPESMMFQPYFKVKPVLERYNTQVFSSNYELYGDMSTRMHSLLHHFAIRQEIYSIDESFLQLDPDVNEDLTAYGLHIKHTIMQSLGLPVAVGIGPSKTLAKLANHLAKKQPAYQGVLDLSQLSQSTIDGLMHKLPVGKVWGIGKRLSERLALEGVQTAYDLKQADLKSLRKKFSVVVERTARELKGESCLSLEEVRPKNKQILNSRSFGQLVSDYKSVEQAVAMHAAKGAQKLRQQQQQASFLTVFIRTNPFKQEGTAYRNSFTSGLIYPSNNTTLLIKHAKRALHKIWQAGPQYHKVGVILSELSPEGPLQEDIFAPNPQFSGNKKAKDLMQVMDDINQKMGKNTVNIATQGITQLQSWQMRREHCSLRCTTRWDELIEVT